MQHVLSISCLSHHLPHVWPVKALSALLFTERLICIENYSGMGAYWKFLYISPRLRSWVSFRVLVNLMLSFCLRITLRLYCSNYFFHCLYNCCFSQCDWTLYSVNGVFYFIYFNNGCFFISIKSNFSPLIMSGSDSLL